jgi:prepilin-type N-terminal cleavage/methylation domain-containing protein
MLPQGPRGFTLIELLVVIAIITLLVSIALPALSNARRLARTQLCATQLRSHGVGNESYVADHKDRIATFSWRWSSKLSLDIADQDIRTAVDLAQDDFELQGVEFTQAVRKIGHDSDAITSPPLGQQFCPYMFYSTFTLRNYMNGQFPIRGSVCTEDRTRLGWQDQGTLRTSRENTDPTDVAAGNLSTSYRIRYSSSFTMTTSGFQPDVGIQTLRPSIPRGMLGGIRAVFHLGSRKQSDVAFPSQKVFLFDRIDRHSSRQHKFFAQQTSQQPVLLFDGSVRSQLIDTVNLAIDPLYPRGSFGMPVHLSAIYSPAAVYNEPTHGVSSGNARYWFTAGGLKGIDFGGTPIDTSFMRGP